MVDIIANEEALIFDFQTVTTPGPGGKVTGLEAVMQVTKETEGSAKERVCIELVSAVPFLYILKY